MTGLFGHALTFRNAESAILILTPIKQVCECRSELLQGEALKNQAIAFLFCPAVCRRAATIRIESHARS